MRMRQAGRALALALLSLAVRGLLDPSELSAQVSFEQATRDLGSSDAGARLRAVQLLKQAAYPEAALPLAALVTDSHDDIQLEAIAAEINIFLAEPVVPRKRVALVVEVRSAVQVSRRSPPARARSARGRCRARC